MGVGGEGEHVGHTIETECGLEKAGMIDQCLEHGIPAGAAAHDHQPVRIGASRVDQVARATDGILDVQDAPLISQRGRIRFAIAGAAPVIDSQECIAARGKELYARVISGLCLAGWAAVDVDDCRRQAASGIAAAGGRIVQPVDGAAVLCRPLDGVRRRQVCGRNGLARAAAMDPHRCIAARGMADHPCADRVRRGDKGQSICPGCDGDLDQVRVRIQRRVHDARAVLDEVIGPQAGKSRLVAQIGDVPAIAVKAVGADALHPGGPADLDRIARQPAVRAGLDVIEGQVAPASLVAQVGQRPSVGRELRLEDRDLRLVEQCLYLDSGGQSRTAGVEASDL